MSVVRKGMQSIKVSSSVAIFIKLFLARFYSQQTIFHTIFLSSHMYPENPEGTQVILGSMNMGYISDTARNRTHDLFRPKRELMALGHSFLVSVDWNIHL